MSRRPRVGRPRAPGRQPRDERVAVAVTRYEHDQLQRAANQADLTLSSFCHRLLTSVVQPPPEE